MPRRHEPAQELLRLGVGRDHRLRLARILRDELRHLREFGDRVLGVELLVVGVRHELGSARVVGAEELELAVVERAPESKAHVVGRAPLRLQRVLRRPLERTDGALHRHVGGDHQVLRLVEHRGQDRAAELRLHLVARQRLRTLGGALLHVDRLLRRAFAPFLDRLRVAHHHEARTVVRLAHARIARADHLLDRRRKLVDVRRPQEHARQPALRDAVEIALRRLDLDLLRLVVVAEVRAQDVLHHVFLSRRRKRARLALVKRRARGRGAVRALLRRDLQEDRRGIVEEEVGQVLQLVGVVVALQLADDGAERLRLGQDLHLHVQRLRALEPRLVAEPARRGVFAARCERLARAAFERLVAARRKRLALRALVAHGAGLADGHLGVLLRPVGRKVERPQVQERCICCVH